MGTFVGHIIPGIALALLGLLHTINTIRACNINSKSLCALWYPFNNHKKLELVLILSFSILALVMQVLDFPFLQLAFKLDNFEHATMFLHLAVFASFALFSDRGHSSETLIRILLASVFSQELFLLHFHSTDHIGVEGHYHFLLLIIVSVSLAAAVLVAVFPESFPSALVLAVSVVFQGCWFVNMAFVLWVPKFVPHGCFVQRSDSNGDAIRGAVLCESPEADLRARALANLQFSWIFSGILTVTGTICMILASRVQSRKYEQLQSRGFDAPMASDSLKHPPGRGISSC